MPRVVRANNSAEGAAAPFSVTFVKWLTSHCKPTSRSLESKPLTTQVLARGIAECPEFLDYVKHFFIDFLADPVKVLMSMSSENHNAFITIAPTHTKPYAAIRETYPYSGL